MQLMVNVTYTYRVKNNFRIPQFYIKKQWCTKVIPQPLILKGDSKNGEFFLLLTTNKIGL